MKYKITALLICTFVLLSCGQAPNKPTSEVVFQNILDRAAERASGVSMTVIAPKYGIQWSGTSGYDSKAKDQKLSIRQPFRIASITKTFTAVSMLRLAEMEKLDINDPIANYISPEHSKILKQDNYDPTKITIKHCLQHTSGLFDYAVGNDAYVKKAKRDPKKRWTRTEQIQFAIDHGKPVGNPGEKYQYSDTGYIILGEIIEKITGKGLAEANRALINFKTLELSSTWLQSLEPEPSGLPKQARSYLEDLDTTHWDNSVDLYGGGGYVSTTQDIAKFYHSLFNNTIFEKPETLQLMLSTNGIAHQDTSTNDYRLGLWEIKTPYGNGYMHDGIWGSAVIHFPDYNTSIALNFIDGYTISVIKSVFREIVSISKSD